MKKVINLDTGEILYFDTLTPYIALINLMYYLNLKDNLGDSKINKTESGKHLWIERNGETWCVRNE